MWFIISAALFYFLSAVAVAAPIAPTAVAIPSIGTGRAGRILGLPLHALLFQQHGLAAGANAISVDLNDLDHHILAQTGHVFHLFHPIGIELGNMDQGFQIGQKFHDGPDFENAADLGGVVLAQLGVLIVLQDHFLGLPHGFLSGSKHRNAPRIVDVDGCARGRSDGLDVLAAGADDHPDDVGIDV